MSAHENMEHAEHAQHAAHSNKKIALLISVLALFLAFSETLGKNAQTAAHRATTSPPAIYGRSIRPRHIRMHHAAHRRRAA